LRRLIETIKSHAAMKFSLSFEKKNRANLGQVRGHNTRSHATNSQLPKHARFSAQDSYAVTTWSESKLDKAKSLARRKDAVLAIELVIQVGDQSDWRDLPTSENPCGAPRDGALENATYMANAVKKAIEAEFGADNVVSIELHLDESTPHVHAVVTPIKDGKLKAKHWLDGVSSCAALRSRLHEVVAELVPCDYVRGAPGGAPHDAQKAAGGAGGIKPKKGLVDAVLDAVNMKKMLQDLKDEVLRLRRDISSLFQKLKRSEVATARAGALARQALAEKSLAHERSISTLKRAHADEAKHLRSQLDESRSDCDTLAKRNNELLAARKNLKPS
jgi:hypothetical protein